MTLFFGIKTRFFGFLSKIPTNVPFFPVIKPSESPFKKIKRLKSTEFFIMSQPLRSIVFPESSMFLFAKKKNNNNPNRRISFNHLLAVIYVYGGVHLLVYILSKTVLTPMFQQLVYDRQQYHVKFLELLQKMSSKLMGMVEYMPPTSTIVWENEHGVKYCDAQTQTNVEENNEKEGKGDYDFYNPITAPSKKSTKSKKKVKSSSQVKFSTSSTSAQTEDGENNNTHDDYDNEDGFSSDTLPDVRTAAEKADERTEEFTDSVKHLTNTVLSLQHASTPGYVDPLKVELENMSSYMNEISRPRRRGVQIASSGNNNSYNSANTFNSAKRNAVDDVKKEIRSFKGSFLSARNFAPVKR